MGFRREIPFRQLQKAREQLQNVTGKQREAHSNWEKCRVSAEYAQSALSTIRVSQNRKELLRLRQETEEALEQAHMTMDQLQVRRTKLECSLRYGEAAFAQSQLLDFIWSDRYASNPLNFANAMAGMPAVRWRQSMDRCLRFHGSVSHRLIYRQFQVVAKEMQVRASNPEEAVGRMKARLVNAKGRDVKLCYELARNWHFLRLAIESVIEAGCQPEGALPYRIFAEYQRRASNRSSLDILRAEKEAITTHAYLRERLKTDCPSLQDK
jgi:hypothetical protein